MRAVKELASLHGLVGSYDMCLCSLCLGGFGCAYPHRPPISGCVGLLQNPSRIAGMCCSCGSRDDGGTSVK